MALLDRTGCADTGRTSPWMGAILCPSTRRDLLLFMALYVAGLLTYAQWVWGWGPLQADLTEMWAWGKEFRLGYLKHPPFAAWIAGVWFSFMPRTSWSFHFLATLNGAIGLAGVWALAGLLLGTPGRWMSILALVLTPSFTLSALKFNANAPLLSLWPWAAYFFVSSLQTRRLSASVLAGLLGAAALLTKYYSIVLLASFLLAALLHPSRRAYFRSPAPYVSAIVGLIAVAPHLWWVASMDFSTFEYVSSKTRHGRVEASAKTLEAMLSAVASLTIAAAGFALAFGRESWALLRRSLAGTFDPRTAWIACLVHGPILCTFAAHLFANFRIANSYLNPVFYILPIGILAVSGVSITAIAVRRLALFTAAVWVLLILASPLIGYTMWRNSSKGWVEPRQQVALAATDGWRAKYGRPLRFVSGTEDLAKAVTFYSPDAPSFLLLSSPIGHRSMSVEEARRDEGVMFICRAPDRFCLTRARSLVDRGAPEFELSFVPNNFGSVSRSHSFVFIMQPPRGTP